MSQIQIEQIPTTNTDEVNSYNYLHFNAKLETKAEFKDPNFDDSILNFRGLTTDGKQIKLSDFKGKTVVIESGSFTCPSYVGYINPMNKLADKFPNVEFLVLYVREAHPGSKIGPHQSMDNKLEFAKKLKPNDNENRTIIVDDLIGSIHSKQILLPNFLLIVNEKGKLVYRSEWNNPNTVEKVLKHMENPKSETFPRPSAKMPSMFTAFRVMKRGGWNAILDMMPGMPRLLYSRLKLKRKWKKDPKFH